MPPVAPPSSASPAPAAPGAGGAPGQSSGGAAAPPFGSSPATQPTQNLGHVAMGMTKLSLIVQQLGEIIPLVGAASEPGQAVLESLRKLSKFVQPGSASDADKMNQIKQMMAKQQQMAPQLAAMRAAGGGAGGPPGQPSGQSPQQPAAAAA